MYGTSAIAQTSSTRRLKAGDTRKSGRSSNTCRAADAVLIVPIPQRINFRSGLAQIRWKTSKRSLRGRARTSTAG